MLICVRINKFSQIRKIIVATDRILNVLEGRVDGPKNQAD